MATPEGPDPHAAPPAPAPVPGFAPVCVVKRFRKGLSGPSLPVKGGDRGQSAAKSDELADSKPDIQTSKAASAELGGTSCQATDAPTGMGNAQSSQSHDALRGSDPVDLGFEKPEGQPMASGSGLCVPVKSPAWSHVNVGPSLAAQSGATLRGSEAEDLVPEKPDGQILIDNDNVHMGSVPSVQHRDASCATKEMLGLCRAGELSPLAKRNSVHLDVSVRLVEDDDSSALPGPAERPPKPDKMRAHQHAQPRVPRLSHAMTSCHEPVDELGYPARHAAGVRDAPPFLPGVSEASPSVMHAKDGAPSEVVPKPDGRRVPPAYVARQQDYLRSEVSPTPSSSDAETVRVPFPEVQLEFTMRQDAPGRPVSAPHRSRCNDFGAEAQSTASNADRTNPEPTSHSTCGPNASAQHDSRSPLGAPAGDNLVLSPHFSGASELGAKCPSTRGPVVPGNSVQGATAGTMDDEARPGPRRVFMGPAGFPGLPKKELPPGELRVVTPISSRPIFAGPGSIPRRAEAFSKQAATPPCDGKTKVLVLDNVHSASEALLPGGQPLPPRPPTPKRKRCEPEGVSRSSGSASSEEGVSLTPESAEAFLARLDARPTCPSGHPLFTFGSPEPNWWCSVCKREFTTRVCCGGAGYATLTCAEIAWPVSAVAPPSPLLRIRVSLKVQLPATSRHGHQ